MNGVAVPSDRRDPSARNFRVVIDGRHSGVIRRVLGAFSGGAQTCNQLATKSHDRKNRRANPVSLNPSKSVVVATLKAPTDFSRCPR